MCYDAVIKTPIGNVGIKVSEDKLTSIAFLSSRVKTAKINSPFIVKITTQLNQYFADPKFKFDLPIELVGTELQQKIWQALRKIPVGKTITYKELAYKLHSHPRVIGNACRRNPIPLIIPCHRVVATGGLGGFCGNIKGPYLAIKQWLLNHEARER